MPSRSELPVSRRLLLLPAGAFVLLLVLALALAVANARWGSVHLAPGEHLRGPALAGILAYGILLFRALRAGAAPLKATARRVCAVATFVSTLAAAPVIGLFIAPAVNGLVGLSVENAQPMQLQTLVRQPTRNRGEPFYFAVLRPTGEGALGPGRYFLGSYSQPWRPDVSEPQPGALVLVRYRTGLLGATTVLSAWPQPAEGGRPSR